MTPRVTPYTRRANYYETDRMGIIHHSNYIRWFEEARLDYMRKAGISYADMEADGVIMPVTGVSCQYRIPIRFDETVAIRTVLVGFNGVRAAYRYEILTHDGKCAATGESSHCFLDERNRRPLNLKKRDPELCERCAALLRQEQAPENKER